MNVYLDASALIPLFIEDGFTAQAKAILTAASTPLVVGDFARAEFASVIGRAVRIGRLPHSTALQIFADFDMWADPFATAETTTQDVRLSEVWLRRLDLNLRAPDALHIAIAARLGASLATFDVRIAEAAEALGVRVAAV